MWPYEGLPLVYIALNFQFKSIIFSVCNFWVLLATIIGGTEVHCDDRQDNDVGGDKNLYIILLQNLEKELSPLTVSEFIRKQTSIAVLVHIFPSLPWEPYTNGVIVLASKKDLEQLFNFLQNPNHFIVSLNGR